METIRRIGGPNRCAKFESEHCPFKSDGVRLQFEADADRTVSWRSEGGI